jgi:hypothetical protein
LDYVDIHINTNLIQWFLANVLYEFYFYETGMTPFDNDFSYIILDESLCNARTLEIFLSVLINVTTDFTDQPINFPGKDHYLYSISDYQYYCYLLYDYFNIIIVSTNYNGYLLWDMTTFGNTGYNSFNAFSYNYSGEKVATVGTTWLGDVDMESEFLEIMHDCYTNFYGRNQNYFLVQNGYVSPLNPYEIKYTGMSRYSYTYWLHKMLDDFLYENDLTEYDNWPGRCDVTFKLPFGNGQGAWSPAAFIATPYDLCLCVDCGCMLAFYCGLYCDCQYCCWEYKLDIYLN